MSEGVRSYAGAEVGQRSHHVHAKRSRSGGHEGGGDGRRDRDGFLSRGSEGRLARGCGGRGDGDGDGVARGRCILGGFRGGRSRCRYVGGSDRSGLGRSDGLGTCARWDGRSASIDLADVRLADVGVVELGRVLS